MIQRQIVASDRTDQHQERNGGNGFNEVTPTLEKTKGIEEEDISGTYFSRGQKYEFRDYPQ